MLVYKIVDLYYGAYTSYARWAMPAGIWVRYELHQVARPILAGSKLFAFDSKQHAAKFARSDGGSAMLECECEGAKPYNGPLASPFSPEIWVDGEIAVPSGWDTHIVPEGTVLVDWLKPLKLLRRDDVGI